MNALVERFAASLSSTEVHVLGDVRDYVEWQTGRRASEFSPTSDDDVDLRNHLLELQMAGAAGDRVTLRRKVVSLKRFYEWAHAEGLIDASPFAEFDLDRPILDRSQIRRRRDALPADPNEREISRLRALNHLAEQLNRSADLQTALDATLETLVEVMGLKTAWVFLLNEAGAPSAAAAAPPNDFAMAAACGLPPGLEGDGRLYLRQPPDCHCQKLLRVGRMTRAVNIVECTRLQDSAEAAGDNQGLLFHASTPLLVQGKPRGIINVATDEWQFLTAADLQLLSAVGAQVAIALDRARLYDLAEAQRRRLERELEMARAVQASLLPGRLPDVAGFSLAADWRSAREVAGDFYDIFSLPGGRWGIVIGDVSDKGAPAALYMAMSRSLIRAEAERASSPAATLAAVNRALGAHSTADMFVSVFYATLDPATRSLIYVSAGHNPPLVRRAGTPDKTEQLRVRGPLLGVFDEVNLTDETMRLERGDVLVAYTDGVTDAENPQHGDYGLPRLAAALADAPAGDAPAILAHLLADVAVFAAMAPQPDDITMFVVASESGNAKRAGS